MGDTFSNLQSAAHSGAFGAGSKASPTPEQIRAGNYAKGSTRMHGMHVTIETPMFQSRRGKQDGKPWSVLCMAHYGYINGTKGADGDAIDIFVGPMPESLSVFVVNQVNRDGAFDEHKVMLGFADEESARNGYMNSYEKGWTGLGSLTACSIKQFKYWLKHGDLNKPLQPGDLSKDEALSMSDVIVRWEGQQTPVGASLTEVIYDLRKHDPEGLLMDSATLADINEHLGTGGMLDAMVIELQKFDRKAGQLLKVMQMAAEGVKPTGVEISKPFKNRGTTQVAMLFAMDDGQSVSVFFHNPDSTPNKLTPTDELVSWKWVLNKKDITITVAPEKGQDLNPREVARRIMKLVEKNSAKFIKANEGKADRDAKLEELKAADASKTNELADLDTQITDLTAQLEAKKAALTASDSPAPAPDEASVVLKGPAGPVTVAKTKYVDTGEWGVSWASTQVATAPSKAEGVAIAERVIESGAENIADMRAAAAAPAIQDTPSADSDADYMAKSLASAETLKAQIVALGGTPYSPADFMAKVNAGEWQGFSLSELQSKMAEAQSDLVKVQSGNLTPRRVVGKGGTKKGAIAWLSGRIAAVKAALDADGFMYTVNVSNYTSHLRDQLKALQGAPEPAPVAKPSAGSTILEDYADVAALGSATVLSVGSENVYFDKDGTQYMTKLLNTDDYESKVGEVVDLSGVVDPSVAPAAAEPVSAAPVVEPGADEDQGDIAPEGRENTVKTAKGTKVATGFKIIEARNLVISHEADGTVNPDYPAEIQPRDRARTTSQAWVQKTARNLDPDSLGRTQRADSGAPIVGKDRVVESGNGRAMAIREAYRIGQADEYRDWLVENADYFGVDVAKIKRMKAPVLVRVRISDVNRVEFAVEANQDDKLAMTATEKARSDAKRLDAAMLAKLADGDLNSAANRDFVAAFLQALGDAEAAQYLTTDGKPTSGLISRLQAALFAGAYSDDRLLELTADVAKPEIANIVAALNSAAPDFMRAKEQDRVGAETAGGQVVDSVELSLNQEAVNAIISATNVLRQAKESGMGLEEFLRQGDMFGGTDPAVAAMALFIQANNRSAKRMGTAFKAMAQFVESENTRKQTASLFGDEPASFSDIVAAANRKLEQEYGEGLFAIDQGDMFAAPAPAQAAAPEPAPAPEPDEDDQLQQAKAYLDSLIEGSADLGAPAQVLERLESIYAQFGEGELKDLFEEASNAFRDYALKVTASAF